MRSIVENVIYFYLFICIVLLVFNVLYIFRSKWMKRARANRIEEWKKALGDDPENARLDASQQKKLEKVEQLTALSAVLDETVLHTPAASTFFQNNAQALQMLALAYRKRPAMERAFFAYVIASFHTSDVGNNDMLAEILLSYLDHSTVFCRENVLQALYALGREQAVEHAFDLLNERGQYHNPKLISDGMIRFTGDREALALRLWKHRGDWEEPLTVGVVQFASQFPSEAVSDAFAAALESESLSNEICFALIRYFGRHVRESVRPVLLRFLEASSDEKRELAIPAASVLASYPCEETKHALMRALTSRNWYVRRNAAMSLKRIGITDADIESIRSGGDRYALEMLEYAYGVSAPARKEAHA